MLVKEPRRQFALDGITIRQGVQPAGTVPPWMSSVNFLIQHLVNSVNVRCAVPQASVSRRVVPGDIHIIPEGTRIHLDFSSTSELFYFTFDEQRLQTICNDLGQNGGLKLNFHFSVRDTQISSLIHALREELRSDCARGDSYVRQLSSTLIRYVASTYSAVAQEMAKPAGGLPPNRLRFILDHIHSNIRTRLFSKDLAKLVQMSPQHFGNLFRQSTGRAPYEYILCERIEQGKRLLAETQMPIMEVAIEVGFAHHSHFGDAFRQHTGMTPKQYRLRNESFWEDAKIKLQKAS